LRGERALPRLVLLPDGDQLLPIDFDNALSVDSFVQLAKNRDETTLIELFPGPDELCAVGPEGRFVHELIVPFLRERDPTRGRSVPTAETPKGTSSARRRFRPGSEWLTATLYVGPAETDEALVETVAPLIKQLVGSGAADRWFFVRFSDPDWHLRIRLHGVPERLHAEVQPALERAAGDWRLRFDTYEREVERYGGLEAVELAEQLFHADSDAVLEVLGAIRGADDWRVALAGMDSLITDLGFDLEAKETFARFQRDFFARELRADNRTNEAIGKRFRDERQTIESVLAGPPADGFSERSARLRPIVENLRSLENAGRLGATIEDLAGSFVHMHLNRMLRSGHRRQELVLYEFLARLYRSRIERSRADSRS
jgi:thiopeptide-type bacteriocin biosynthesis protein